MKIKIWSWAMVGMLVMAVAGVSRADEDARTFAKLGQNSPQDSARTLSFYLVFKGSRSVSLAAVPSGDDARFYTRVWDDLYLQASTVSGDRGVEGYMFSFSKDEEGKDFLLTNESRDVPSLREVSVSDFRTEDNYSTRPLLVGPGTAKDRGPFRMVHYKDFDVEIRVLEFTIGSVGLKHKPFFETLSCLVTVIEKVPRTPSK